MSNHQAEDAGNPNRPSTTNNARKSRYRVPTVCGLCRRRKMKCDKAKPHCSSCVKNKSTHLCVYEEQPWATDNETQRLKDQIFALQQQNNELKNLLNQRSSSLSDSENFNVILPDTQPDDPVLDLTEKFDVLMLKESKMSHFGSTSYMSVVSNDPILKEMFSKYLKTQNSGVNFKKFFLYDQGLPPITGNCDSMTPESTRSIFEAELNKNHLKLVESINEFLPNRVIVTLLIDHFFSEAYLFFPYLDETSFRKNVESILSVNEEGRATLVVSSVRLMVTVAVLLCVLRISFISLPKMSLSNSPSVQKIWNSQVIVGPNYIEYAKACISNASTLRKPSLKHIQALLILRLYRFYAPEDGDESSDSTIFLSMIVQMARMHGMYRDPERYNVISDHATANIWRKIWYQLMFLDAQQAMLFGCPLLIDDEYDTLFPIKSDSDSLVEIECINDTVKLHEITLLIRDIVKSCSKIKVSPKRSDIEKQLFNVEYAIGRYRPLSVLKDLNNPADSFLAKMIKSKELVRKLVLYGILSSTYFILLLTCGPEEIGATQRYTSKAAESTFIILKVAHEYVKDPAAFSLDINLEAFISASIFEQSKRVLQAVISFSLRDLSNLFNFSKVFDAFKMPDSIGLRQWLMPVHPEFTVGDQVLIRILEFTQYAARLSNRYFACWRVLVMNELFMSYLDGQFPGKLEDIHQKLREYTDPDSPQGVEVDVNVLGVRQLTFNENHTNKQANEIWTQLIDASNQSSFDYLEPNINRFDAIGDPYFNGGAFLGAGNLTFEDYNSFYKDNSNGSDQNLGVPMVDPKSVFDFKKSISSTDESPSTDTFDGLSTQNTQSVDFPLDGFAERDFNLDDQTLAMQVARSIFGTDPAELFNQFESKPTA